MAKCCKRKGGPSSSGSGKDPANKNADGVHNLDDTNNMLYVTATSLVPQIFRKRITEKKTK